MNNFTKDELDLLKYCILRCKLYDKQFDGLFDNLDPCIDKIQSLIDNYCEHVNAVIDEKLKCIYCGHPSSIEVTKYKGLKRACDE